MEMQQKQTDPDPEKITDFKATSYIHHQAEKLAARFNAYSYWLLSNAMDSHQLSRGRSKTLVQMLESMRQKALIIGISSDILCPVQEQELMAQHMPNASLCIIHSDYGHDGFLVETEKIPASLSAGLLL